MKYCNECGGLVHFRVPDGDSIKRYLCESCGMIHYSNPKIIVGCIPILNGKILLCRRAIEPGYGLWTLPAGYLENGEDVQNGARRETFEETGIEVKIKDVSSIVNIPFADNVYIFFEAVVVNSKYSSCTSESIEVNFFEEKEIPWNSLAFKSVEVTLRHYFNKVAGHTISVNCETITEQQYF